jgi:tetratricopeptide (TPR) repeat protein
MADRISAARDYIAKKPQDRFGLYTLAMELRKALEYAECFEVFDRLLGIYTDYGPAFYHYAQARRESGDIEGARGLIVRGLAATENKDGKTWRELLDLQGGLNEPEDED